MTRFMLDDRAQSCFELIIYTLTETFPLHGFFLNQ